jgi:coatomer protein complex subunit gamma
VDIDPDTGEADGEGFPDEYPLETVDITSADYMRPVGLDGFRGAWEAMGKEGEVLESFALPIPSVADSTKAVFEALGMAPCDGTGTVAAGAERHNAYLSGVFLGGMKALARLQVSLSGTGTVLKIAVRSEDAQLSRYIVDNVA